MTSPKQQGVYSVFTNAHLSLIPIAAYRVSFAVSELHDGKYRRSKTINDCLSAGEDRLARGFF
jgi:hypothetical protein